ncbi:glycosyltransferase family 2 protein [Terrisporobacter vanillatitrophus]|uniref:glycosyltransferase family 2 protein n=1 Tax=Terrisporobacter vanillatitrophus TaxID=3058402 RepID=UPI00336720DB
MKKVSMIVPVYNSEKYIEKCIQSILNQSYKNIEIIIINDGSKDSSDEIITKLEKLDSRIKYIKQENSGPSQARNNGIRVSSGKYLMFVDSDDSINENYVELMVNKIEEKEYDVVCCGYKDISIYGTIDYTDFPDDNKLLDRQGFMMKVLKGTGGVLWSKIFRKEIINKYNIAMDKNIFMSEDLIFVLKYCSYCNDFGFINNYLYNYNRLNEYSISANVTKDYINNYIDVCKHIDEILLFNKFDKNQINKIISERLQSTILNIIDSESIKIKEKGIINVEKSIKQVISLDYIKQYKSSFKTNSKLNKPCICFLKNNCILAAIMYSYFLNILRCFKNNIKVDKKLVMEK